MIEYSPAVRWNLRPPIVRTAREAEIPERRGWL
jgi:hypothetical protein